ncbi:hypothetical protein [Rhizorhapis sp. SPR117]|uniref:hypothetical protein n=1 Tax=Rhizorhapis sp. SPR117 TaxID=2912611 RepID=UPI001F1D477E|nr:hypothetical protein [Rhizorhapis sp. SPR117]
MPEITLRVPEFLKMDDEAMQAHSIARRRDGRWSALSQYLIKHFETDRLNLNEAWANTPLEWMCPACRRPKIDIARKTGSGLVLCQLEWHHDHLGDAAMRILRERAWHGVPDAQLSQRKRACAAVLPLIERFAETLVCVDCNAADAAMKAELGPCAHRDFSFSPLEIGAFVRPRPHSPHERDLVRGREIWAKADAEFRERLRFVEQMAERLGAGLHDREQHNGSHFVRGDEDARMFLDLAREQVGARGELPHLAEALRARSCAADGHRSVQSSKPTSSARAPSLQEFAAHDEAMQKPGPWRRAGANWQCACCFRSKREIMRISSKGKWTGQIHEISDYEVERDSTALRFRSIYREEAPIFRSARQVTICQDCRLLLTDAGKLRSGKGRSEDHLSPDHLRSLVGNAVPHARHRVSDEQLRAAIAASRHWSEAAADFWKHRDHVSEAALKLAQLIDGRGLPPADAHQQAIADLTASGSLPSWDAAQCFDWLMDERVRLKQ